MVGLAAAALVFAAELAAVPPSPTRWVEDPNGFLSPGVRASLDAKLQSYERATGHQLVVWIGTSLNGAALDDWAVRTFAAWKVGRKGLDDGVAMFILAGDRKVDIEVGYGLEDKIPDAIASRIIYDVMVPQLKTGDRDGAVTAGVDAMLAAIEGKPFTSSGVAISNARPRAPPSMTQKIVGGILLVAFVIFAITHPRMALFLLWTFFSRRGGGGFGGGGFGGGDGGGGGFGGGGGSSGGGGARGGW